MEIEFLKREDAWWGSGILGINLILDENQS